MRIPIPMPKMGYDMTKGTVVRWLVEIGDPVTRGQPIAEIETDKVVIEMESLATGRLVEILQGPESEVAVGVVIGYLDDGT